MQGVRLVPCRCRVSVWYPVEMYVVFSCDYACNPRYASCWWSSELVIYWLAPGYSNLFSLVVNLRITIQLCWWDLSLGEVCVGYSGGRRALISFSCTGMLTNRRIALIRCMGDLEISRYRSLMLTCIWSVLLCGLLVMPVALYGFIIV